LQIVVVRKVYLIKRVNSYLLLIVLAAAQCILFDFFIFGLTTTAPAVGDVVAIEVFVGGSSAFVFGCFNIYKLGWLLILDHWLARGFTVCWRLHGLGESGKFFQHFRNILKTLTVPTAPASGCLAGGTKGIVVLAVDVETIYSLEVPEGRH
jgi:hypothetical protein